MKLPAALARSNRYVANRVQGLWAPYLAPWAVVEHTGRRSGTPYHCPVLAWTDDDRLGIVLAYGRDTDWVRNVLAAGGCGITRRGRHQRLVRPRIIPADSPDLPFGARIAGRPFEWALMGTLVDADDTPAGGTSA
ncbi:nitroreductase family deazaflavin-dependent oxidoreductase [Gordonia desulfuricans]|uniref:Nitroreductase family deazaflavin-dependent oxidoreductase n=1 Tax=Gordonia desulfuricans TaxID=89051 RepID=A0A7K3LTB1_9ACTN|nr:MULTISPECIES: nitroreductase family deazaflavin-dependent oxidoreductase [Gordonia]KOY49291.1 hypothetical protein ISGA_11270 [Gordonia sp. NB41Y]NDK91498.1 nitroreductase family deazaflavin-dependent oxidoreductase [Gordonia desulfuricans]WLP91484.1 nitroreductase family deazaflavin-dependent oxidoreductase [Gordonia sp. NB41Y]